MMGGAVIFGWESFIHMYVLVYIFIHDCCMSAYV